MKYFFIFIVFIPFFTYSQELTVIKKNGKLDTLTKTLTYEKRYLSLNGNIWKIGYRGKGRKKTFDLKKYSATLDSLYRASEALIYKSLQHGITTNDTVAGKFHYVWEDAVLRKKGYINTLEYKLKVTKN